MGRKRSYRVRKSFLVGTWAGEAPPQLPITIAFIFGGDVITPPEGGRHAGDFL
jgi:hypothetical protein